MRKIRKYLSLLMAIVLVTSLCSCGGGSSSAAPQTPAAGTEEAEEAAAAENAEEEGAASNDSRESDAVQETGAEVTPQPPEQEPTPPQMPTPAQEIAEQYSVSSLPVAGEYELFAVRNEGYTVSSDELGASSTISLAEEGGGSMTSNGESMDIASWSEENGTITITLADDSVAKGDVRDGVIELDIYGTGEMLLIYAQEDADISGYELLTVEEYQARAAAASEAQNTRLGSILSSMDTEAGVRIRYQLRLDALDTVQEYDVHTKGDNFYSCVTTKTAGVESRSVTFIQDGKVYELNPDKMTGTYIADLPLSITNDSLLMMDSLYSEMRLASIRTDRTEEEREAEGVSYSADVYPSTEYQPEIVFFYSEDGKLLHCFKGTPIVEAAAYLGESFYTIETIDSEVDESLFDISAYTVGE